ncbi:MAG: helicase associated domain-containing protein [Bacteroidales bacterium]|nr:helicase associated domain-containing protein [Bacteroidales bacterium]
MTHDEIWKKHYREYSDFIYVHSRVPSRHRIEEHTLHSWWKQNRKQLNAGKMKPERIEAFKELIVLAEAHRHLNQYK